MKNAFSFFLCLFVLTSLSSAASGGAVADRLFGTNGTTTILAGPNAQAKKVKGQPDGKLVILGSTGSGTSDATVIARFNADGSPDATFGNGGIVIISFSATSESLNDLAIQADGKIVVAGSFFSVNTQSTDFIVARFTVNGSIDPTFGTNGVATVNQSSIDSFNAVAIQADGKIIAAGSTSQNFGEFAAIRFNANGTLDSSFNNGGLFFFDSSPLADKQQFLAISMYPGGKILMGGSSLEQNGNFEVIVRLLPNGQFDTGFAGAGAGVQRLSLGQESSGPKYDMAVLPDGKFMTVSRIFLGRFTADGEIDSTYRGQIGLGDLKPLGTDIAVRSDGRIIVLGQGRAQVTDIVAYENNGREINRAKNLSGADVAITAGDRFWVPRSSGNNLTVTRYVSITSQATRLADVDYDGKTDFIVSRGGSAAYILRSASAPVVYPLTHSAGETVRVIPEDYYSSNPTQFPLFSWRSSTPSAQAFYDSTIENGTVTSYPWGIGSDIPVGGDYDGETRQFDSIYRKSTELAIFRPSTGTWWIFDRFTNTSSAIAWGMAGDKPVPADYDYDGITDLAIYRPSTGVWWIRRSSDGATFAMQFGFASDIPLTGDYDGDGRADLTVYRPSEGIWYQYLTSEGFKTSRFGLATDIPVPGDYDGDGRHDIAVYRSGIWYLLQSTAGFAALQWGNATDTPVSVRYDQ